jgi:hypothetical protein
VAGQNEPQNQDKTDEIGLFNLYLKKTRMNAKNFAVAAKKITTIGGYSSSSLIRN